MINRIWGINAFEYRLVLYLRIVFDGSYYFPENCILFYLFFELLFKECIVHKGVFKSTLELIVLQFDSDSLVFLFAESLIEEINEFSHGS